MADQPIAETTQGLIAALERMADRYDMTATERYEQDAEAFYQATGYMAPGKDVPMAMGGQDVKERRAAHEQWIAERNAKQQAVLRDALASLRAAPAPPSREWCIAAANAEEAAGDPDITVGAAPASEGETPTVDKAQIGLYQKFRVSRTDGSSLPGGKHDGCAYFVLDMTHDKHAAAALLAYAESCRTEYPILSDDLRAWAEGNRLMEAHATGIAALAASPAPEGETPSREEREQADRMRGCSASTTISATCVPGIESLRNVKRLSPSGCC